MGRITAENMQIDVFDPSSLTTVVLALKCHINDYSYKASRDEIEVSTFCDTEYETGQKKDEFEFTAYPVTTTNATTYAASPQGVLRGYMDSGLPVVFRVREQGAGTGKPEYSFTGVLLETDESIAADGVMEISVSGKVNGTRTHLTQA